MITIRICMKVTNEPPKRTPIVAQIDTDGSETGPVFTDRTGTARFDLPAASGKVRASGVERYHGRLDGEILIDLWSITQSGVDSAGTPRDSPVGSNAYPGMTTRCIRVGEREILTDSEGYLVDPGDWSEAFAKAEAAREDLELSEEHWELIRFLRGHFATHGAQATVRDMIRHFRGVRGRRRAATATCSICFPAAVRKNRVTVWLGCCAPRASTDG
jgi:tRNA 2-thiouridine synthesizing protein E